MAFLRVASEQTGLASNIFPIIQRALRRSGEKEIVDLCAGGGGPVLWVASELAARGEPVAVTLTDIRPDEGARELAAQSQALGVRAAERSSDAWTPQKRILAH